ncbi:pilus (MSHA type) biogenesis protein MshL [Glaciecola sp. KUL10]|uniref:pilus (MSHA type) biogenesis protein MshL n=1 Tax=Glaciecola sp. (strain KUL10) TaxID=2161813 RepID=UPI000D78AAE7|nr:pilus (MSHA type) biogenesis protein MshL [Glaciecola sp. KUL10]GBL03631.1 pilus (MSHA type) biogenesis protein MshL [Glaciecola sp. KUL10]
MSKIRLSIYFDAKSGVFLRVCSLLVFLFGLNACATKEKSHVEASLADELLSPAETQAINQVESLDSLPQEVADTLLSLGAGEQSNSLFGVEKYDISARDVDAVSFFSSLVDDTPYSVALHPAVQGNITLDLKQVELGQVMSLVSDLYGFHIEKMGNIFRVFPAGLRTETFSVNYLLMQRDGNTQTSIISGGVSQNANSSGGNFGGQNNFNGNNGGQIGGGNQSGFNSGTSITTRTETNFWDELQEKLMTMIGEADGRAVMVSPQSGLVTVRALPDEIKSIKRFLNHSEKNLQRQVVIEARILEVILNDEYQQGINWTQVLANAGSTDFQFATSAGGFGNEISAALGGVTSLSFLNQDFSGVVNLLETQGNIQVLSSPRVTAINNQKAVIKVGDDEYFVTDISSQNTITANSTSVVPDIELTPFFSGIALDVTPQIDENGSILLHIHPSVIETQEQEKVVTLNQEQIVLPLAQSTIRESDTIIRATSGEIVVIGGLMQSVITDENSQTPLLGDIPVLGNLFKNKRKRETKKELIILLKPTVVGPNTWKQQMEASRAQMADWLYVE